MAAILKHDHSIQKLKILQSMIVELTFSMQKLELRITTTTLQNDKRLAK